MTELELKEAELASALRKLREMRDLLVRVEHDLFWSRRGERGPAPERVRALRRDFRRLIHGDEEVTCVTYRS